MSQNAALWAGIFAGPLAFLAALIVNFALAPLACLWNWVPALLAVTAVALALAASAGMLAFRQWVVLGRTSPGDGEGGLPRARMMAVAGMGLSILSSLAILAQVVVEGILKACA